MQNNEKLAALILGQISGETDITKDQTEFVQMLQDALQDGQSRLDLRDRLVAGARDTNTVTLKDIIEVMSQSLSDEIRDLGEDIAAIENDLIPSRLALSSLIGLVIGTVGTLLYGSADIVTSMGLMAGLGVAATVVRAIRKRSFKKNLRASQKTDEL